MKALRDGDIGVVPTGRGLFGKLVLWAGKLGLIRKQKYQHVAIVYQYGGDCHMIEAGWLRVGLRQLNHEQYHFYRPVDADHTAGEDAAMYAACEIGEPYGYLSLAMLLWRIFRDELQGKLQPAEAYICSELAVTAWRYAGIDIVPGVDADQATPDMIADSPFVQRVVALDDTSFA